MSSRTLKADVYLLGIHVYPCIPLLEAKQAVSESIREELEVIKRIDGTYDTWFRCIIREANV